MKEPIFIDDESFLHHINKMNVKHLMNFLPGGGGYASPASLDIEELERIGADYSRIETVKKQKKFYSLEEDELLHGLNDFHAISQSYRMEYLISASKFRNGKKIGKFNMASARPMLCEDGWVNMNFEVVWSSDNPDLEKHILNISEIEIAFELGRREHSPNSPSRITCLYMVENTLEGQLLLSRIYGGKKRDQYSPFLLNLGIVYKDRYIKADSNWYELYIKNQNREHIKNYWLGNASNDPKWEILFEGVVGLRQKEQKEMLKASLDSLLGKGVNGIDSKPTDA